MTDSKEDGLLPCPFCGAHLQRQQTSSGHWHEHMGEVEDCYAAGSIVFDENIAAWNRRASSPPVGGSGEVVVKALDWGETSYGRPEASTVVGVYRIYESVSGGWSASRGGLHADVLKDKDGRKNFATLDAAKAAAQADYETRIRSALAAPVPDDAARIADKVAEEYAGAKEGSFRAGVHRGAVMIARRIRSGQAPYHGSARTALSNEAGK